nr:snw/ski-interacting protein [Quercus suber]
MTVKDQQDWKVPPCISNWKNPKGYTIPLDKRLAADGRGLQDVQINDNFAKLSEALYISEQKAQEAVTMRSKVQKEMMMKEKERKEHELRALAQKARFERTGVVPPAAVSIPSEKNAMDSSDTKIDREHAREKEKDLPKETREECKWREKIREERRREREKERKLEAKDSAMRKKSKITRDRNRDVSEKVALGMASAGAGRGEETMYDQRLFNQEKGMDSGFAFDDQYNVYDQGLFTTQPMLSTLYRPKKDVDAEIPRCADGPLEFENVAEEDDIFQLDQFMTEVNGEKLKTAFLECQGDIKLESLIIFRAEELETELMKMVKQDNQWQLSARVEQLGQELAELKQALADKRVE